MSTRWTRVPDRPPPSLPGWAGVIVPVADGFMWLMLSRPRTGSLRDTWVTAGTLLLCVGSVMAALTLALICALTLAGGGGWALLVGLLASLGCLTVSGGGEMVGTARRRRWCARFRPRAGPRAGDATARPSVRARVSS